MPRQCGKCGIELLPLAVFLLLPTTFITTYVIAVLLGHVDPGFPYISDTGTNSPESCIFGQLLNISAVLIATTMYIRYKQIAEFNRNHPPLLKWNKASFAIGLISAFGLSIVANFQETNVKSVHLTGAVMAFGLGTVYSWMQTYMSHYMCPYMNSQILFLIRLLLSIGMTFSFFLTYTMDQIARTQFNGTNPRKWLPSDGGFTLHIISTASEWIMSALILCFFATFIHEFKNFTISSPQVYLFVSRSGPPPLDYNDPDDVLPITTG